MLVEAYSNPRHLGIIIIRSHGPKLRRLLTDLRCLVANQLQEMEMVRQKVFNLEQTQIAMKQR